jgi:hypothetical protein
VGKGAPCALYLLVCRTMSESGWAAYKLGITITLFGLWQLWVARRERFPNASKSGFKVYG